MTREELKDLMWEQEGTLQSDDNHGWYFVVTVDGETYRAPVFTDEAIPGDDELDWDKIYDEAYTPYAEALDVLLDLVNG